MAKSSVGGQTAEVRNVSIKSRATLSLQSGEYTFETFTIEPQATVLLDASHGPVILHMRGECFVRGDIKERNGRRSSLVLACFGSNQVSLERPLAATVVAPRATLNLASVGAPGFTGAFFANQIVVQPDTVVTFVPFGGIPFIGV